MSNQRAPEYFADLISNVSHANGVFRITFAQQEAENTVQDSVRLLIPANQSYQTKEYKVGEIQVQGTLSGIIRKYI